MDVNKNRGRFGYPISMDMVWISFHLYSIIVLSPRHNCNIPLYSCIQTHIATWKRSEYPLREVSAKANQGQFATTVSFLKACLWVRHRN